MTVDSFEILHTKSLCVYMSTTGLYVYIMIKFEQLKGSVPKIRHLKLKWVLYVFWGERLYKYCFNLQTLIFMCRTLMFSSKIMTHEHNSFFILFFVLQAKQKGFLFLPYFVLFCVCFVSEWWSNIWFWLGKMGKKWK